MYALGQTQAYIARMMGIGQPYVSKVVNGLRPEGKGSHLPCWTIQSTTLNLQNADEGILRAALAALGFGNIHTNAYGARLTADRFSDGTSVKLLHDGRVEVTASSRAVGSLGSVAGDVARAYSEKNVEASAKENGWEVEWATNADGNRVATLNRGGY